MELTDLNFMYEETEAQRGDVIRQSPLPAGVGLGLNSRRQPSHRKRHLAVWASKGRRGTRGGQATTSQCGRVRGGKKRCPSAAFP